MVHKITLILILHNRHKNIDRLLEYYGDCTFPIIIADSSKQKHVFKKIQSNWLHHYTLGLSFTQKIEVVIKLVVTPYVVMCADDDFILPESLQQCVLFLEQNKNYAIAQGWSIRYYKESVDAGKIRFGLLYDFSKSIEENDAMKRLADMFQPYRSILYAVFKTDVLQQSFAGAGKQIKNLFLNEYITAFLPILHGKYKELPLLYQVREFAEDSDDKTAMNIDTLLENPDYKIEFDEFKNFILNKMVSLLNCTFNEAEERFNQILQSLSEHLKANRNQKIPFTKRVGKLISVIPFIGNKIINRSRQSAAAKQLESVIKTQSDKDEVTKISNLLMKFQ